jgi:hypothetical protein
VVLSSQRVPLKDALYNAAKGKDRSETANPLVQNRQKTIPSVTRVFSKSREMYVYLQAYDQNAPAAQPFIAFVSLYSGPKRIYETKPIEVTSGSNDRLRTTPIQFSLALGDLAPGKYDCQVTILEPTGQKAAFWQAPIMLVP